MFLYPLKDAERGEPEGPAPDASMSDASGCPKCSESTSKGFKTTREENSSSNAGIIRPR
ncbi:hypothetical protein HMPREF0972_00617 [Actinomyces sp. oral taxon 848 str. F0332]|nr:hypothetical protein HMPREF0972_00617 [Actinomyces sp. oral taxon 848 str. F0332]